MIVSGTVLGALHLIPALPFFFGTSRHNVKEDTQSVRYPEPHNRTPSAREKIANEALTARPGSR
jgi:hypothetical protein